MSSYDFESSHAFVKRLEIKPYQSGILDKLCFAVKDLFDIAGEITGCGNPDWADSHPKAAVNAVCVEQLLLAGATCVGKTVTDELAYSLAGENYFYGTPINPKAPDRVPGGSSSGSASAVACGLVDFAIGTDTGGSVRVPANNCGIWGYRPSHGHISVAGVNPFAPSFDTVGVLAKNSKILAKVISILVDSIEVENNAAPTIFILDDVFAICDTEVQEALLPIVKNLAKKFIIKRTSLKEITKQSVDIKWLLDTFTLLQASEIWSCLGPWVENNKPHFGETTEYNFYHIAKTANRLDIQQCIEKRKFFARNIQDFLKPNKLLCFPTTPAVAVKRGTFAKDSRIEDTYYPRALGINAISGLSRNSQITMPLAEANGVPVGLSLLAGYEQDNWLAKVAYEIGELFAC